MDLDLLLALELQEEENLHAQKQNNKPIPKKSNPQPEKSKEIKKLPPKSPPKPILNAGKEFTFTRSKPLSTFQHLQPDLLIKFKCENAPETNPISPTSANAGETIEAKKELEKKKTSDFTNLDI